MGCVAGAVADESVKKYAHKKGLYVLEKSVQPAKQAAWKERDSQGVSLGHGRKGWHGKESCHRTAWEPKPPPSGDTVKLDVPEGFNPQMW
jgi:hypothetical protein